MAASRLQNWAYFLSAFNYKIECIKSEENIVVDALSRLPSNTIVSEKDVENVHYVVQSNITCLDYKAVARETAKETKF